MNKIITILITLTLTASAAFCKTIELTPSNSITIGTSISNSSVDSAMKKLVKLHSSRKPTSPIYIVLDSPGGSIMAGNKLIRFANTLPNIHTICMFCASMAHAIQQGIKGTRYALPDNILMAHRARGGFQGQFENGEVESQLKLFKSLVRSMELRNAKRIGISLRKYKRKVVNEWWTYGKDSLDQNIVDEIVDIKCSTELLTKTETITTRSLFGSSSKTVSACPLLL